MLTIADLQGPGGAKHRPRFFLWFKGCRLSVFGRGEALSVSSSVCPAGEAWSASANAGRRQQYQARIGGSGRMTVCPAYRARRCRARGQLERNKRSRTGRTSRTGRIGVVGIATNAGMRTRYKIIANLRRSHTLSASGSPASAQPAWERLCAAEFKAAQKRPKDLGR